MSAPTSSPSRPFVPSVPRPAGLPALTLSDNALTILRKRYLPRNEAGEVVEDERDLFWRVATVIADVERRYGGDDAQVTAVASAYYRLMAERRFMPNSPTLMNAGRPLGQLSACFVLPVADAIANGKDGIYDTLSSMARVHQSGGGTGFSFSRLRPKGAMVKSTSGVASGPISFMKLYDASTDAVKQGGTRRGANMGVLRIDHPDVLEFITCKQDLTQITNFNLSVAVTAAFMAAVQAGTAYDLLDPQTGTPCGTLDARQVWDTLIDCAWRTGEPGVLFIDEANRYNPVPHLGAYEASNPCVTGETLVYTTDGLRPIAELAAEARAVGVTLDSRRAGLPIGPAGAPFSSGVKAVFRLVTREGYALRVTADHRMMTERGWVTARDLVPGDRLHILDRKGAFGVEGTEAEGRVMGWLIGDGHLTTNRQHLGACLSFYGEDRELAQGFADDVNSFLPPSAAGGARPIGVNVVPERDLATVNSRRLQLLMEQRFGLTAENKTAGLPIEAFRRSEAFQRGLLAALFSADGHVSGSPEKGVSVRLTSVSMSLLQDVQRMLLNFGIASRIYAERHPRRTMSFRGASYECQPEHDLVIGRQNVTTFASEIGFIAPRKQAKLNDLLASYQGRGPYREMFLARFEALIPDGEAEVFDLSEPVTNSFVANGLVVHNCGEQFLLPYDVCNLGSINLGQYVIDTPTGRALDWEALGDDARTVTRFLDGVIDANQYPLPEITDLAQRIRRIGLGVMGFADALIRLGIAYDSPEGVEFGRRVQAFVDEAGKRASEELADERGPFAEWERSIWGPDATCARDADGHRIRPMRRLRNCNISTVAPTGTISIIAGCSSGLEPLFAVAFMRNQAGVLMPDVNEDFVQIAKTEGWYSDALMARIATEGRVDFPEVPAKWQRVFVTANRIAPEYHIRMQAAFQAHCDSSISKTTNFAHAATREDVRTIYEMAFDLQCKGVTVYRDGSRDGQVLSTGATAKAAESRTGNAAADEERRQQAARLAELAGTIAEKDAEIERLRKQLYDVEAENLQRRTKRSRPDMLRGTTIRKETPLGTMFVNITEDDKGQPFEVFVTLGKAGGSAMADAEAMGRLLSLALRSGISLSQLYKQLAGISSDRAVGLGPHKILSVPDAIAKALYEWQQAKQGTQQELIPLAPVVVAPHGTNGDGAPTPAPAGRGVAMTEPQPLFDFAPVATLAPACPECGAEAVFESGCVHCSTLDCGWSECG